MTTQKRSFDYGRGLRLANGVWAIAKRGNRGGGRVIARASLEEIKDALAEQYGVNPGGVKLVESYAGATEVKF